MRKPRDWKDNIKGEYVLDRKILEERLSELAETPFTGKLAEGAMCYLMASYDSDYNCTICGRISRPDGFTVFGRELNLIRKIVEELKTKGFDVLLDESEYCDYCRENSIDDYPQPVFMMRFNQDDDYNKCRCDNSNDYMCLATFLSGGDVFVDNQAFDIALHDRIDRISKMSGLKSPAVEAWARLRRKNGPTHNHEAGLRRTADNFYYGDDEWFA